MTPSWTFCVDGTTSGAPDDGPPPRACTQLSPRLVVLALKACSRDGRNAGQRPQRRSMELWMKRLRDTLVSGYEPTNFECQADLGRAGEERMGQVDFVRELSRFPEVHWGASFASALNRVAFVEARHARMFNWIGAQWRCAPATCGLRSRMPGQRAAETHSLPVDIEPSCRPQNARKAGILARLRHAQP